MTLRLGLVSCLRRCTSNLVAGMCLGQGRDLDALAGTCRSCTHYQPRYYAARDGW
jgi:hypothetical protein